MQKLEIVYFTDPLCCWSWAMEPQLRRIQYEYKDQIQWRYCMGGLLPSWDNYYDEINSVSRPIQMGPVWMHAQYISGMPMNSNIWMDDAPASSYPACIAFKNASLQSKEAGARYLRLLREAVMIRGENIAKEEVLINIAISLSKEEGYQFCADTFRQQLREEYALNAFRQDLREVQSEQIQRFPAFILKGHQKGLILNGYRPYEVILDAIHELVPDIEKVHTSIIPSEYAAFWQTITDKEREAILSKTNPS